MLKKINYRKFLQLFLLLAVLGVSVFWNRNLHLTYYFDELYGRSAWVQSINIFYAKKDIRSTYAAVDPSNGKVDSYKIVCKGNAVELWPYDLKGDRIPGYKLMTSLKKSKCLRDEEVGTIYVNDLTKSRIQYNTLSVLPSNVLLFQFTMMRPDIFPWSVVKLEETKSESL